MIHSMIDNLIRDAGAQMYQHSTSPTGWLVGPSERQNCDAVVEWVARVGDGDDADLMPSVAPAHQFKLVCKSLSSVGLGWSLETKFSRGHCIRLHVRPTNTAMGERILEHIVNVMAGMNQHPLAYGSREARELSCLQFLSIRQLVSGQEAQVDDVLPAWIRAVNKVRGEVLSTPLFASFEERTEEDFMSALMEAIGHTKRRLPLLDAHLRRFEAKVAGGEEDEVVVELMARWRDERGDG
jgi:hypothetical protein